MLAELGRRAVAGRRTLSYLPPCRDRAAVSGPPIYWQLGDSDAKTFREGHGLHELANELRNLMTVESEHTPKGFIPSGNISIYWSRTPMSAPSQRGTE